MLKNLLAYSVKQKNLIEEILYREANSNKLLDKVRTINKLPDNQRNSE